jgi:3-oxoacyl-[acyl-carrier protein] reductase
MDKTVLITGGSGAVGSALVRRFAADGYRTVFTYRKKEAIAKQLAEETGATCFYAELRDREQVQDMVQKVLDAFETIDILVNNAGQTQVMPFALIEDTDWDEILTANLKTMFIVTQEAVRNMIHRRSGVIINIGSLAGHRLLEVPVHYATAKAGVTGFTLSLAKELSRYNIRVNEVVPGLLSKGVGTMVPEKEMAEYLNYCTAGRAGEPEEVASLVAFLASEQASYINAQSISVDGGI